MVDISIHEPGAPQIYDITTISIGFSNIFESYSTNN